MDVIDISVIGSGIASTLTLIEVLSTLLANNDATQKKTIAVIEKDKEFFKGIPYGARSSVNALTITSVLDFTNEQERPHFFKWLKANKHEWAAYYRLHGGITADRWLKRNIPLMDQDQWETIYTPRFLYGNYLHEKIMNLIDQVHAKQLATIMLLHAEATNIECREDGLYDIAIEHAGGREEIMTARKVVIAAGSAPVRNMYDLPRGHAHYFNDIYDPSVSDNLKTLHAELSKTTSPKNNNILIIGSNASSIELLYLIEGMPALRKLINKIVIISTSGILPYHISTKALDNYPTPALNKIKLTEGYDITALVAAAAEDVKLAVSDGANMDHIAAVINTTLHLMEPLDDDAKRSFFAIHGVRLRDMFRRSGPEYKGIAELLIQLEEVTLLKGKYLGATPAPDGVTVTYKDTATEQKRIYPSSFKAIINCSGSDNLDRSSSRLLYNLVHNKLCNMNMSGKGFEVNERFEAAPRLYVMGPLLAGNMNKLIHFWQLENASRLTYLAPFLSKELLENK